MKLLGLEMGVAPIDAFVPNPWNPNRMDERTYEAERESIRMYGFIDPTTVRPHPTEEGKWEILDGEHRWKAAADEGLTEISFGSTGPISDEQAKKLTIIFNETRGDADVALLGKLLADLDRALEGEDLSAGLPYSDAELKNLIQIGSLDWDSEFGGDDQSGNGAGGEGEEAEHKVQLSFTESQFEKFQMFSRMVTHERQTDLNLAVLYGLELAAKQAAPSMEEGEQDAA